MNVALVGDVHGEMHAMVANLRAWEEREGIGLDFVLQVGDFEPHRTLKDLAFMEGPRRHKHLGDFHDFIAGRSRFPWPVFFVGGNHEPHGFLEGFTRPTEIVPNCVYLGRTGWLMPGGLRLVGLSGIFASRAFRRQRPGTLDKTNRKEFIYFNAQDDISRLLAVPWTHTDVLLMHDWPAGVIDDIVLERVDRKYRAVTEPAEKAWALPIADHLNPQIIACGHHHMRCTEKETLASGAAVQIMCLSDVPTDPQGSMVFIRRESSGRLTRL